MPTPETAEFRVVCGKGTYVRALARDLGRKLGCYGHIIALRRTRVGPFDLRDAVSLDDLERLHASEDPDALLAALQPIEVALESLLQIRFDPAEAAMLARGQSVLIRGHQAPKAPQTAYATSKGRLIALGDIDRGALHPFRVFNYGA